MKRKLSDLCKIEADIIKTLSHPTRIFIVRELAKKDLCVCHLTKKVGSAVSTVSKHLTMLKNNSIVSAKKCKSNIYYSLKCKCVLEFLDCASKILMSCINEKLKIMKKEKRND